MRLRLGLSLFAILFACGAFADEQKDFSSWTKFTEGRLVSETETWTPGSQAALGFKITFAPHWHTYWLNPGDSGAPVRLSFKTSDGVKIRQVDFPIPQRLLTGPLISFAYSDEVLLPIQVEVSKDLRPGDKVSVSMDAEWLVCAEVCIPAIKSFSIEMALTALEEVKPAADFALFQKARSQVPSPLGQDLRFTAGQKTVELKFRAGGGVLGEFVEFFPFRNSGVTNELPAVKSTDPLLLEFQKANVPQADPKRVGVLVVKSETGVVRALQIGESGWSFGGDDAAKADGSSLVWMLVSALIGGLILNLMPCVFPILSIKLLSLLKLAQENPREVRRQNFAYVAGVLFSFLLIALVLSALRSAGQLVGWGFQLQSPVFLAFLIWLFLGMTLNLLGVFEVDWIDLNIGHQLTVSGGLSGSFFTGVLAVVVASPCTAPFMGVALGFGLSQSAGVLFAVFLALGLGLAMPYLAFAIFPRWARVLPRPGLWMKYLKQVMALPLLATAVWLAWIFSQMRGPGGLAVVGAGALVLILSLSLTRRRKKPVALAVGLILLAGLVAVHRLAPHAKETSLTGAWQPYSEEKLSSLKGRNVLVDMTADWCLTCKVNEKLVLNQPEVQQLFTQFNVVLLQGDWTNRNPEITQFLNRYQRVGVPFYVLYSARHPDGLVLPEVLVKNSFIELISSEFQN